MNEGIKYCRYDLIARMDTDDIALPHRFKRQLEIFIFNKNVDICGSWVSEFENNENNIVSLRKVPENNVDIIKYSKKRNPINHPSVMYKKSIVINSGNYQKMMWFEDYFLWVRLIQNNAKFYNIQEALVNMRAGYGQLERRGGLKYAIEEFKFLKELNSKGFLSRREFYQNSIIRFTIRILPKKILKNIYMKIRE